jgi:hypothetical protein
MGGLRPGAVTKQVFPDLILPMFLPPFAVKVFCGALHPIGFPRRDRMWFEGFRQMSVRLRLAQTFHWACHAAIRA